MANEPILTLKDTTSAEITVLDFGTVRAGETTEIPSPFKPFSVGNAEGSVKAREIDIRVVPTTIIKEPLGTSNGLANQEFQSQFYFGAELEPADPIACYVNDAIWSYVVSLSGAGTGNYYTRIHNSVNKISKVKFGNGIDGSIPAQGATIKLTYSPQTQMHGYNWAVDKYQAMRSSGIIPADGLKEVVDELKTKGAANTMDALNNIPVSSIVKVSQDISVVSEDSTANGTWTITTLKSPIQSVSRAYNATTLETYAIVSHTATTITLSGTVAPVNTDVLQVDYVWLKTYAVTTDYILTDNAVDWSPAGEEPAVSSIYKVTYKFIAIVDDGQATYLWIGWDKNTGLSIGDIAGGCGRLFHTRITYPVNVEPDDTPKNTVYRIIYTYY